MKNQSYSTRRGRRRNPYKWPRIILATIVLSLLFYAGYSMHAFISGFFDEDVPVEYHESLRTFDTDSIPFDGHYQRTFADLQDVQIATAMELGIEPLSSADAIQPLLESGRLVEINESILYEISETGLPYLIPEAKALLDEIALRYQSRIGYEQPLRLTGCLRTNESVSSLMHRNINSVKNSCHLYGTTFDISYRYLTREEKRHLAQVLYELQQANHCYVKYEYKQPCFHITVRPDPS